MERRKELRRKELRRKEERRKVEEGKRELERERSKEGGKVGCREAGWWEGE